MLWIPSYWCGRNQFLKSHKQVRRETGFPSWSRSAIYIPHQNNNPCCLWMYTSKYWDGMFPEYDETGYSPPGFLQVNIFFADHMFLGKRNMKYPYSRLHKSTTRFSVSGSSSNYTKYSFYKSVPALGCNIKFISSLGQNLFSFFGIRHITQNTDIFIQYQFFIIFRFYCKEQLIIFSAAQRTCSGIQFEFISCIPCFFRNGNFFFIKHTTNAALFTKMQDLRTQSVADIHHRGGLDLLLFQEFDGFFRSFGFKHPPDDIFFSFQIGPDIWIFKINFFLPLQKNQSQVSSSQIAAAAEQVTFSRS